MQTVYEQLDKLGENPKFMIPALIIGYVFAYLLIVKARKTPE